MAAGNSIILSSTAMQQFSSLSYFITAIGLLVLPFISIFMVQKKLFHELPIFFAYTIFQSFSAPIVLFIHFHSRSEVYFYSYWIFDLVCSILMFFIMYEIYQYVFRSYIGLQGFGSILFQWALAILFLLAVLSAASTYSNT